MAPPIQTTASRAEMRFPPHSTGSRLCRPKGIGLPQAGIFASHVQLGFCLKASGWNRHLRGSFFPNKRHQVWVWVKIGSGYGPHPVRESHGASCARSKKGFNEKLSRGHLCLVSPFWTPPKWHLFSLNPPPPPAKQETNTKKRTGPSKKTDPTNNIMVTWATACPFTCPPPRAVCCLAPQGSNTEVAFWRHGGLVLWRARRAQSCGCRRRPCGRRAEITLLKKTGPPFWHSESPLFFWGGG